MCQSLVKLFALVVFLLSSLTGFSESELSAQVCQPTDFSEISNQQYADNYQPVMNQIIDTVNADVLEIPFTPPRKAKRKKMPGVVLLGYWITEEGKVKDVEVIDEFPMNFQFADQAIKAAEGYQYDPQVLLAKGLILPHYVVNSFAYKQKRATSGKAAVDMIIVEANKKNGRAQYVLSQLAETVYKVKIKLEKRNALLLASARNKYAKAQFLVGINLIHGLAYKKDLSKGVRWLQLAASQDHDLAKKYLESASLAEVDASCLAASN